MLAPEPGFLGAAVASGKAGPALCELEAPDPGAGVVLPRSITDLEFVGARDLGLAPGVLIVEVRHVNVAVVAPEPGGPGGGGPIPYPRPRESDDTPTNESA